MIYRFWIHRYLAIMITYRCLLFWRIVMFTCFISASDFGLGFLLRAFWIGWEWWMLSRRTGFRKRKLVAVSMEEQAYTSYKGFGVGKWGEQAGCNYWAGTGHRNQIHQESNVWIQSLVKQTTCLNKWLAPCKRMKYETSLENLSTREMLNFDYPRFRAYSFFLLQLCGASNNYLSSII